MVGPGREGGMVSRIRNLTVVGFALVLLLTGVSATASASKVGSTSLVSLRDPSSDFSADRNSQRPAISANGNIIAF
jgi:hypothetical protein